jgi:DNA repair protein RadC
MPSDKTAKENPHVHHRKRLTARYERSGFDDFEEHNILELLLFYAIPRADTNPTAHALIDRFGSLYGVLTSPQSELTAVRGVGPASASLLRSVFDAGREAMLRRLTADPLDRYERLTLYAAHWFAGKPEETVALLLLEDDSRLHEAVTLSDDPLFLPASYLDAIREAAHAAGCRRCILMHSHAPEPVLRPSPEDLVLTARLWEELAQDGIALTEHLIVSGFDCLPILDRSLGRSVSPYLHPGQKPLAEDNEFWL